MFEAHAVLRTAREEGESDTETKLYIDSKFVKPVNEYIKPVPNKIKQEYKDPNKKYFKPADVADSEFLYKVDKMYTPNDCNSILKYIEIKSAEDINKDAPNVLNNTIKEYSPSEPPSLRLPPLRCAKLGVGQETKIRDPIKKMKVSIN